ncbi:MAG TPA: hypothetical protein VFS43_41085 [Polyangiaceae bacterium]|nr:hypothetical protein [Polyangiaceae bacterium]
MASLDPPSRGLRLGSGASPPRARGAAWAGRVGRRGALWGAIAVASLGGCSPRSEQPAPNEPRHEEAPAEGASEAEGEAPAEAAGEIAPRVEGAGEEVERLEWFAVRGVSDAALLEWFLVHLGDGRPHGVRSRVEREWARAHVVPNTCRRLRVGEPAEDAIFCADAQRFGAGGVASLTHGHVFVARKGHPAVVLDVPLSVEDADWPAARDFDLSLAVAEDGRSVVVRDRAAEGTKIMVRAGSFAGEEEAELHACDGAIARAKERIWKDVETLPAKTFGERVYRESERQTAKRTLTLIAKGCAQRGRWVWRGGRFVRG